MPTIPAAQNHGPVLPDDLKGHPWNSKWFRQFHRFVQLTEGEQFRNHYA